MSIQVTCPSCDRSFKARDDYAGKRVKCPKCRDVIEVPAVAEPSEDDERKPERPPVRKPPVRGAAVPPPAAVMPPPVEGPAAPPPVAPAIEATPGSTSAVSSSSVSGSYGARRASRSAMPVWAWVLLASVLTSTIVGVGVYAATRAGGNANKVAARDGNAPRKPRKSRPASKKEDKKKTPEKKEEDSWHIRVETDEDGNIKRPKPIVAKTVEQVKEAIVKLVVPQGGNRVSIGTGFLINNRGWVATNNHVIKGLSTASRAEMYDGRQYTLAGIIAKAPDRDLAIVKLEDPPLRMTVMDISFRGNPELTSDVRACGHPHNLGLTFVKGCVGRVATTQELLSDRANNVLSSMKAPGSLVWIQHDALIKQGNSGGPLFDNQCRVLGINTFINELFGYAIHVQHLQALAASASDSRIEPLPEYKGSTAAGSPNLPPMGKTQVSVERLQELFDACAGFGWKPEDQQQYDQLAEFAKLMTHAKHAALNPAAAAGASPDVVKACAEKADELFGKVKDVGWAAEHLAAVNKFATAQLDKQDQGIATIANVLGASPNALLLQVEGTNKRFLVPVNPGIAQEPPGSRWLVLGVVSRAIGQVNDGHGHTSKCRVIGSHYMFKMQ